MNTGPEQPLAEKGVLVTGGLGALGTVVVERLTAEGARVIVNDLAPEPPVKFSGQGYVQGSAGTSADAARIIDETARLLGGPPHVVCCHAGIVRSAPLLEYDVADFQAVLQTNLTAQFALAQAAARLWVHHDVPGHLIFTGSWVQDVPWPGVAAYSAAKAGLKSLMRSFARELAPYGIRANGIAPGIVGAGMALKQWNTEPDYRARASRAIPLGALQSPDSVADAMGFLASDRAQYMTGSTLLADGGASLYPMDQSTPTPAATDD